MSDNKHLNRYQAIEDVGRRVSHLTGATNFRVMKDYVREWNAVKAERFWSQKGRAFQPKVSTILPRYEGAHRFRILLVSQGFGGDLVEGFTSKGHHIAHVSGQVNNLAEIITEVRPQIVITTGSPLRFTLKNLEILANRDSSFTQVHYDHDGIVLANEQMRVISKSHPDFVFSPCKEMIGAIRSQGIAAEKINFGFSPSIHRVPSNPKFNESTVYIGYAYTNRFKKRGQKSYRQLCMENLIYPFAYHSTQQDFQCYGNGNLELFERATGVDLGERAHGQISMAATADVYGNAKLCLAVQNYPDWVTKRTFESMACGGIVLANDSEGIRDLFQPGENLFVSNSAENSLRIATEVNAMPQRQIIEMRAAAAAAAADHTTIVRAQEILGALDEENLLSI
ncbi:MAG: glycosyltransferase [Candidatus Nanopelagicales bacterium]